MPLGVLEMLHGKSAQAIAVANTAILMELIQELVRRGSSQSPMPSLCWKVLLTRSKMDRMHAAREFGKAMDIIRLELVPRL